MKRAIRKYARDFIAIVVLAVIAAGVAGYILSNQRLRFPIIQESTTKLNFEFSTAQAVTPGQGQTLRVSGVKVGDISKVTLKDGVAVVTTTLDPEYKGIAHIDAKALLRPKTGLKDMFIDLDPGTKTLPVAKDGFTIPVQNTLPDINPDEVYSALDADTRDYLKLLIGGAGQGLKGRGHDLQEVFRRFEPTHRDLALINKYTAKRHRNLSRVIHSLNLLNKALADKGDELAQLVDSSSSVFRAFASEQANISRAVADLPGALRQTTQTLGKVDTFARVLAPTAENLRPAVRSLNTANKAITPFAKEVAPLVKNAIRPFVRDARPVVRQLRPAAKNLAGATPDLTRSFVVLNHLFNMLGFNPNGREGPDVATRDEGYLFWLAWLNHDGAALFSSSDAHGPFRPVTVASTCQTLKQTVAESPELEFLQGLTAALTDPAVCGTG
ncbi:MAG: phospholipid/cholesterol/gamma-HCH transport system substrate-binding protein [Solirubrobacteraceae bacterium]|jgi:phospholipid/cholesterol/gamma-HCH transport system substrate-binding protein|nr:phospholipid/cholesterol/gamma-HCH transport system substrate-binding protein [Solirubrobacteraceae bacterium]